MTSVCPYAHPKRKYKLEDLKEMVEHQINEVFPHKVDILGVKWVIMVIFVFAHKKIWPP